jgi:photosystem II stability/assembly factor-like uncharacterized protein
MIFLDAPPAGVPLYTRLGFVTDDYARAYSSSQPALFAGPKAEAAKPFQAADLPAVATFGAQRKEYQSSLVLRYNTQTHPISSGKALEQMSSVYDGTRSEQTPNTPTEAVIEPALLRSLEWRLIGPYRGGRVVAVAGDPVHNQVFYFGSTGGGVWKTTDGGRLWENVSDGFFKRASVGAIAVAESDPNVVYVGMGEATIRGNVSHGDGVYKSTDGGQTWTHLGLAETRNIGKVRIHPQNPDLVYVAALGHAHGPNPERGVYRSRDGGKTWEQILFRSEKAGAIDLSIDPNNPRILYAAFWEAIRRPHELISGGEGSGLFKSTDGGDTWMEISHNKGLPKGLLGKIGVVVSPAKEGRVWAVVEAEDGAVYRSDDGGQTWEKLSEEGNLRARAWYYMHIYADPQDAETLWVLNVRAWKSIDGGKNFFEVSIPHGDNHDLWIDPRNPLRMINGNDGGACVSFNGGESWSSIYNQPTAEFYHVITSRETPYRVYGAQQDNTTLSVPSRSSYGAIIEPEYLEIGGGESGYIAVRPDNPDIIFAGSYQGLLTRYDRRTFQERNIIVWPQAGSGLGAKDMKYRFQWTYPIALSPHDPNILYVTGNRVFRSTDEGSSWQAISPDLTRNDPSKLEPSGGPITKDNTGAEYYCTIFAFAESPVERGLLWAGSDDGLVHISRDGGQTWENVTPSALPEWALISIIEPSPHDPATAYLAATRYKLDDFQPYFYKTHDYGKTWTKITTGIAENEFSRTIREDPIRRGLLYAGTETGIRVSFDDGAHWQSLQLNLPVVPIHDLLIHDTDLVVATHGRSFWILDDITPLRQIKAEMAYEAAHLFHPRATPRFLPRLGFGTDAPAGKNYRMTGAWMITTRAVEKPGGIKLSKPIDAGENPPVGVIVNYYLKEKPEGDIRLTFLTADGKEIRTFSSTEEEEAPTNSVNGSQTSIDTEEEEKKKEPRISKEAGANRFVWNMRYPDARKVSGYVAAEAALAGPIVPPGTYTVRLTVGEIISEASFEVTPDPRLTTSQAAYQEQFDLLFQIRDRLSQTHDIIYTLRTLRKQVNDWERKTKGQEHAEAVKEAGAQLKEKLTALEEELIQTKAKTRQDTLNHPVKFNAHLAYLGLVVSSADAAPTSQSREAFAELAARVDEYQKRLQEIIEIDIAAFNARLRELQVPALVPPPARF